MGNLILFTYVTLYMIFMCVYVYIYIYDVYLILQVRFYFFSFRLRSGVVSCWRSSLKSRGEIWLLGFKLLGTKKLDMTGSIARFHHLEERTCFVFVFFLWLGHNSTYKSCIQRSKVWSALFAEPPQTHRISFETARLSLWRYLTARLTWPQDALRKVEAETREALSILSPVVLHHSGVISAIAL